MKVAFQLLATTLLVAGTAFARPQIQDPNFETEIVDTRGAANAAGGYGPAEVSVADIDPATVDAVFQVVKTVPADYSGAAEENEKVSQQVDQQFANCSDYTKDFGYTCVPYYQCNQGTIITNGAGLIDIRIDAGSNNAAYGSLNPLDSKCEGFLDVCCKDPDFVPPPKPKLIHKPKCGRHNEAGLGARIQGFKEGESQFGEWPHMCAVLHDKTQNNGESGNFYKCGGSLIAPGVVLTGAHCVNSFRDTPSVVKVRCGEWDTQRQSEPYAHQDRYAETIKIHPEFTKDSLHNDFALIFLKDDFELDFHIDTICLPRPNEYFEFERCYATGWGKDNFGANGTYQVVLKEIEMPVVNSLECQKTLRTTRLGEFFKLHDSFICAGGEPGKDTCKGDGGSPLVCPSRNDPTVFEQAGIVAWGIGCGENRIPGVYASVSKAACWIDYAMTCHYGGKTNDFNSFLGYDDNDCGAWMTQTINRLNQFENATGSTVAAVFENLKTQYQECNVAWLKSAPYESGKEAPQDNSAGYENEEDNTKSEVHISDNTYNEDFVDNLVKETDNSYVDPAQDKNDNYADSETVKEADSGYSDPVGDDSNSADFKDGQGDAESGYSDPAGDGSAVFKDGQGNAEAGYSDPAGAETADIKEVQEETNQYK